MKNVLDLTHRLKQNSKQRAKGAKGTAPAAAIFDMTE
jgi:hypothetical protein